MWIISIVLGFIFSSLLYLALNQSSDPSVPKQVPATDEETSEVNNQGREQVQTETANNGIETTEEINEEETNTKPALTIEKGKRAIAIPVTGVQSVSRFIQPGDFVDVVAVVPAVKGTDPNAQILLQKLKVLAVGSSTGTENNEASSSLITLEVLPEEGAALAYTVDQGFYTLMLRDPEDKGDSPHIHVTMEKLNKGVIPK
ncbi:Flp pilus assembly protein CpaB [Salinibacillus aidingensis]